ncbi:TIM-barrel domain-containing protein [Psychroflexus planctonicus]|uniref:Alpha-glucosidase n=1 Tax=Psychroflexus planctonicus TaxID=1526575 RepID=A0ABQ1SEE3_9FLAO|nr:TIM-barrel domain-containing protein [Psychroflexus planctonicus]GGE32750.1 alpha-glucosidase [Psychroflexus planctonicus]
MNRIVTISILLFLFCFQVEAQKTEFKNFSQQDEHTFLIETSIGFYEFNFINREVLQVRFLENKLESLPESHAVELPKSKSSIEVKTNENTLEFFQYGLAVEIQKQPFAIRYVYKGEELLQHKNGFSTETVKVDFKIDENETLMGGGARALGMNRRGHQLPLYNRAHYGYETRSEQMNFALPIVFSSKKYLLHFDNPTTGNLDLDSQFNNTITYEATSGAKRFQLIAADDWETILQNYTALTGKQPLPARWTLGNFASRFGYHSQDETEMTVAKFKEEQIPLDAVILDLYWFGNEVMGTMGNLEFEKDSFPNPERMMKRLKDQGVKTVLITEPFMLKTSHRWEEAVQADILVKDSTGNAATYDFFFGNTALIDVFDPKAKDWFWNIYKGLKEQGATGWWGDLGEPEVHPAHLIHYDDQKANEVHNIYGTEWAKIIFENYQNEFPEERPFILMRAGYSGAQKYGMMPWSGDVNRTWGGFQSQAEISLQMGMQGLGYMHSDLGGFAGDLLDDELYVRWLQYGVFQPIYRPHAQEDVAAEPVFRSDYAKNLAKKAIELRYQLLPYNYHLAFENSTKGIPLMRPLFMEEPDHFELYNISQTYLWGNDFLVSPVLEAEQSQKKVYFPSTNNWFDFYTDEQFEGGQFNYIETNKENIPTFVRAGAFIPLAEIHQTTEDYTFNNLNFKYYFDETVETSQRSFYNDDGQTANAFENRNYEMLHLNFEHFEEVSELQIEHEVKENFNSDLEEIHLELINWKKRPISIMYNGQPVSYEYKNYTLLIKNISIQEGKKQLLIRH